MTNEELAAKIQQGERGLLPALWEQVEKFVRSQADRRARSLSGACGVESDDLYQSGYLALMSAVEDYKPEAGKSFIGFLVYYLKTEFAKAAGYRSSKRDPLDRAASLDAPIGGDEDTTLKGLVADPLDHYEEAEDTIWREQLRAELGKALDTLKPEASDTLRRRYYDGHTLAAVAHDVGVSPERVRQRERQALRDIRKCKAIAQFVEQRTSYYRRVSVAGFHATHTSAVELEVIRRERLAGRFAEEGKK